MRFCVEFDLAKPELPKDFHPVFMSFLKNCLSQYGQEYFDIYYRDNDAIMKSFTFGVRMNKPKFSGSTIFLGGTRLTFTLSSSNIKDGTILYNSIIEQSGKEFPLANGNCMVVGKIRMEKQLKIDSGEIVIKMLSPLILREHDRVTNKDLFIDVNCETFAEKTREIVDAQLQILEMDQSLSEGFTITPVMPKKTVVTAFKQSLDASLGVYKITGKPTLLQFLYDSGIGSRRSAGFGMFEILA